MRNWGITGLGTLQGQKTKKLFSEKGKKTNRRCVIWRLGEETPSGVGQCPTFRISGSQCIGVKREKSASRSSGKS